MNPKARARSTPRGVNSRQAASELNYSSQVEDFNKAEAARNDLLALGIDLDSDLINRLTTNLGAGSTFGAASKAAGTLRTRGSQSGVTYRNVNSGSGRGNAMESIRTNTNEVIQVDMQKIRSVLKELNNRDSSIEPQIRGAVLKLLEHLRILYTRAPEKFIKAMHGDPMTSPKRGALEPHVRLLLERYLDEVTVTEAVAALYPEALHQEEVLSTLFKLIASDDHPVPAIPDTHAHTNQDAQPHTANPFLSRNAGHKAKPYVDLWVFLTLIKLVYDDSRRTFDSKTSNLAHNVEFWNQKRAPIKNEERKKKDIKGDMIRHSSKATLGREVSAGSESSMNPSGSAAIANMLRPGIMPKESVEKTWDESERQRQAQKERSETVAALLGSHLKHYKHGAEEARGRGVKGSIRNETINKDKVGDVLHSPIKDHTEKWEQNVYGKFGSQPPRRISGVFSNDCTWDDAALSMTPRMAKSSSVLGDDVAGGPDQSSSVEEDRSRFFLKAQQHTRQCDLPPARDRDGMAVAAAMRGHMGLQNKENEVQHRRCSTARVGTRKSHELAAKPTERNHFTNANTTIVTSTEATSPNKRSVATGQRRNSYNSLRRESLNQTSMASALGGNQPVAVGDASDVSVGGAIGQQRRPSSAAASLAFAVPASTVGNSISNVFPSFA